MAKTLTKKLWRRFAILAIVVLALGVVFSVWFRPRLSPNLLLITLDTTRADRIGCYGYEFAETPYLDALARRGVQFDRAYAPAPMTSPSHTSLFTGLWPPEHGVLTNAQVALEPGIPTLAELLASRGYDTSAFVAAYVLHARFGLNRGFQVYDDDLSTAGNRGDELHRYRDAKYVIDAARNWLIRRQKKQPSNPFFCWVHLYDPHAPYLPHPGEFGTRFDARLYDGELAYADRQIGRLLSLLSELGLSQTTAIVIVGDHGESLGEHGEESHGYMLHESTLRVPLIIVDPRKTQSQPRVSTPVSLVDLFPTLLELAGMSAPQAMRSRSLQQALEGRPIPERFCYSLTEEPYLQAFWSPLQAMTTERWRYVRTTKPELYDLTNDPKELVNLAEQNPNRVSEFDDQLAAFEATFQRRSGARIALSEREQRALESLGYAGGGVAQTSNGNQQNRLPDIKDMIGYLTELHRANDLIDDGKLRDAAGVLERLAESVPNLFRARLNLAFCRMQLKEYDEAVRWLKACLEIDPNSDRAHDMLGFAYLKLGSLDKSAEHFHRLLQLRPDSETGHLFLGEIYQRQGHFALAMQHYEETLRINPQNRPARDALQTLTHALRLP